MTNEPATTDEHDANALQVVPEAKPVSLGMLAAETPRQMIEVATGIATELKKVIDNNNLKKRIGNKDHVFCEAWVTMLAMLGVTPQERSVKRVVACLHSVRQ